MPQSPLRIAVLMDIAFSLYQEEPMIGINRYTKATNTEVIYFGIGAINQNNMADMARADLLQFITPADFDGILIISSSLINYEGGKLLAERLKLNSNLPIVSIGPSIFGEKNVICDNSGGMKDIMNHLISDHNYTKFAYVSGPFTNKESKERLNIFCSALDEANILYNDQDIFEGYFVPPSGYEAVQFFLDKRNLKPEVIVCANDFMALGVWNALNDRGLSVPHDIAITGFDDIQLSHKLSHQFTSVHQSFDKLAFLAMEKLHCVINNQNCTDKTVLPTQLRIRSSCGCSKTKQRPASRFSVYNDNILYIKENIKSAIKEKDNQLETSALYQLWSSSIHKAFKDNHQVFEYENILRELHQVVENKNDPKTYKLLQNLYTILMEQCNQSVIVEYWQNNFFSMNLRILVDTLSVDLLKDLTFENHTNIFSEITSLCQASSLSLFRFNNDQNFNDGASVLFSSNSKLYTESVTPKNWLPPRGNGSLVINMITDNSYQFGYFLIDALIPEISAIDYLRIRFDSICKDVRGLTHIRNLNKDLMHEVSERKKIETKLKETLQLVQKLSLEDELTGLYNRRGFFDIATRNISYLRRHKLSFFILYADLDGLKSINDRYGHKDGDLAIKSISEVLIESLRVSDILCRLGGDEFVALLSNTEESTIDTIKQRIIANCLNKNKNLGKSWELSISIGYHFSDNNCSIELEKILELADNNLYTEKKKKKLFK